VTTLVTGATGFVGSAVVRALLGQGESVRVLIRAGADRRNIRGLDIAVVEGDLRDPGSLETAVRGCNALYHVAADYRLWVREPDEIYRTNVEGTVALMRAAHAAGVRRIVYTSSVATLGLNRDRSPAHEATPVGLGDMIGHYKRSKYLAEQEVRQLVERERIPIVIVNPSTPIGPRDVKPTPTGRMILDAARGRMPAYVDTGLNIAHVDDVAAGHLLAYERGEPGERYVLGGENLTLREILNVISELTGGTPPRWRLPHSVVMPVAHVAQLWARVGGGEPRATVDGVRMARKHMFFTSAKAERELGYSARPALAALRDAIAWFDAERYS
jgi:dihydroflavonol-4-reductase